jgi:hypothetical protein
MWNDNLAPFYACLMWLVFAAIFVLIVMYRVTATRSGMFTRCGRGQLPRQVQGSTAAKLGMARPDPQLPSCAGDLGRAFGCWLNILVGLRQIT